tara:strand:+ start:49882 stop:50223 length:342 start_codon:yes stop_codon:yes gene_type:complete
MPKYLSFPNREEPVEFLTLKELATECGRSREGLKKMIKRGILPEANFRTPSRVISRGENEGERMLGYRLYSSEVLVPRLANFIKNEIKQGVRITSEQKCELLMMFNEELDYFT